MIPSKIKQALETHTVLNELLNGVGMGTDWKQFNRTVFDFVARKISKEVTQKVLDNPELIHERTIIGKVQIERLLSDKKLGNEDGLLNYLRNSKRTFHWISGKTLQSYWQSGRAKITKLNVLLVFLEVPLHAWDIWKSGPASVSYVRGQTKNTTRKNNQDLIRNYFVGSYFLYYPKSDNSPSLIKAPFVLGKDDQGNIFAETITEGHIYRSSLIELREGILYIHCENLVFDEKENHIFNVGNETNPEVLFGISNTISVKSRLAIGIRNVLVRQKKAFSQETFAEKEIEVDQPGSTDREEAIVLNYFKIQPSSLMTSEHCCSLEVLRTRAGMKK